MRGQKHLCSRKACPAKPRERGESTDLGLSAQIAEIGREVNWKWWSPPLRKFQMTFTPPELGCVLRQVRKIHFDMNNI